MHDPCNFTFLKDPELVCFDFENVQNIIDDIYYVSEGPEGHDPGMISTCYYVFDGQDRPQGPGALRPEPRSIVARRA